MREARDAVPYVAVRLRTPRTDLPEAVPAALSRVAEELVRLGTPPRGSALVRYLVVHYRDGTVEIEVGFPVGEPPDSGLGSGFRTGVLPAGEYVIAIHEGPYHSLVDTTSEVLDAAASEGLPVWRDEPQEGLTHWGGRVERYTVGPEQTPDPTAWRTEVALLLRAPEGTTPLTPGER